MRITITLNGVKVHKEIPDSWDQITYRQFLMISKNVWSLATHTAEIISLFTGIDIEVLKKSKIEGLTTIIKLLLFLDQVPLNYAIPNKIYVNGYWYDIPKDLEFETIAQFEDLKGEASHFSEKPEDKFTNLERWPLIVATYCVHPYSWQAAEKLAPEVFNSPCQEVLAIGNFTLVKLIESNVNTKQTFPPVVTPTNKLGLALKAWQKNMVSTVRFYIWRKRLKRAGMIF